jgi:hypothetical protein
MQADELYSNAWGHQRIGERSGSFIELHCNLRRMQMKGTFKATAGVHVNTSGANSVHCLVAVTVCKLTCSPAYLLVHRTQAMHDAWKSKTHDKGPKRAEKQRRYLKRGRGCILANS